MYCKDGKCGKCWVCRGDEPPMHLLPDPDALSRDELRQIEAGAAEAEAYLNAQKED